MANLYQQSDDFSGYSVSVLLSMKDKNEKTYDEWEMKKITYTGDNKDAFDAMADARLAAYSLRQAGITSALKEAATKEASNPSSSSLSTNDSKSGTKLRAMLNAFTDIDEFKAGSDVLIFLAKVKRIHKLHVVPYPQLSSEFMNSAMLKLHTDVFEQMGESISSFQNFVDYMEMNHSSALSNFQRMQTMYSMEPRSNENWKEFGNRLSVEWKRQFRHIRASFLKLKQKDMNVDELEEFIIAGHAAQIVRHEDPETYNRMIDQIQKAFSTNEVTVKADQIATQATSEAPPGSTSLAMTLKRGNPNRQVHSNRPHQESTSPNVDKKSSSSQKKRRPKKQAEKKTTEKRSESRGRDRSKSQNGRKVTTTRREDDGKIRAKN